MKIFKAEIEAGLREKIVASASLAFTVQVQKDLNEVATAALQKACAEKLKTREGLYPTKSILVSTVWNLNDDVFDKGEVWIAKDTPKDKPDNIDHDEKKIVGHMTGNYAMDSEGKLLADDSAVDDLPEVYHIVNSAVIYTLWQDKEYSEAVQKLIEQIEANEKYVSMECIFRGFDYAVIAPDKTFHTLARSSETAFLTKHLRAYGGDGTYQGHRIGRLLRNITFSGKGYVDKPANPSSIILKGEEFSFSKAKNDVVFSDPGVLLLRTVSKEQLENNIMTENVENLSKQVAELTSKLSTLQISSEKTAADLKAANDKIAELTKAGETAKNEFNELKTKYEGEVTKATELKKVADEVTKARDEANAELAKVRAAELKAKRVSKLVEAGIAKDEAEKKVEAFASLNDEQFTVVADALIAAAKSKSAEADIDVDPADKSVEADASKAVDKTKASDANVVAPADEDNKVDNTKASIAKWLNSQLGGENTEK
jgi:hypothetical protein